MKNIFTENKGVIQYFFLVFVLMAICFFITPTNGATITINASEDGIMSHTISNTTFSILRNGAGNQIDRTATSAFSQLQAHSYQDKYTSLKRAGFIFDTSMLGNNINIESASLKIHGFSKINQFDSNLSLGITSFNPSNKLNLVSTDYSTFSDTRLSSDISYTSFLSSGGGNIFNLNSDGINNINKNGYSCFMLRLNYDINNSFTGNWYNAGSDYFRLYTINDSAANYPTLTISYTEITPTPTETITTIPTTTITTIPTTTITPLPDFYVYAGEITESSIKWIFSDTVTEIYIDNTKIESFDNKSGFYQLNNLNEHSLHSIIVKNESNIAENSVFTLSKINPTNNKDNFYAYIMTYILVLAGLICCIVGLKVPFVGFGGVLFGLVGITTQLHGSFVNAILYLCIICAGFFIGFKGGND
ncbi:MAG: hypothetical protein PHU45_02805 [Bacilli bacterium]|nr:hypothetical protein [Bacilli bacterium]